MDDTYIIDLYWQRQSAAIEETEKKYGKLCRNLAYTILNSREDAEECVSDTWLMAWNSIPPQKPRFLSVFLCRITRNLSIDRLRQQSARKRGRGEQDLILEELEECLAAGGSVEGELEARELAETISRFLHTLKQEERLIFSSHYYLELPTAQIAQRLGLSDGKVRMSLSRSRRKLRAYLREEELI